MASHARAHSPAALRELLLTPGLIHGATARIRPARLRTGIAAFDAVLGGGLPRGALTEIIGPPSSGRLTLAYALVRAVTMRRGLAAWIDLPDAFEAVHAEAADIDLARLLWIRPRAVRQALQATEHVLDTQGFVLVVLDLDQARAHGSVPTSAWMRLTRAATRTRTALVVLARTNAAGTFAAIRVETERRAATFAAGGPCPLFAGITTAIHLRKSKLDGSAARRASVAAATGS